MKAILQYGQFTAMIELPEVRHTVSIVKPFEALSFAPLTEQDLSKPIMGRLDFRIEKQLSEDIWLYTFVSEA